MILHIPIRTASTVNRREHWAVKARRVKAERNATRLLCGGPLRDRPAPVSVTLVRVAPRLIDSDNATIALKAIRDEIASIFGVDDGPTGPIAWVYAQRKGAYGVDVVPRW